jgi:hypothetical protein
MIKGPSSITTGPGINVPPSTSPPPSPHLQPFPHLIPLPHTDHLSSYGICAGIIPWNAPLLMTYLESRPRNRSRQRNNNQNLRKGTPYIHPLFSLGLLRKLDSLRGWFRIVNGFGEVGAALAGHMFVRKVSFTGSLRTGKIISEVWKVPRPDLLPF